MQVQFEHSRLRHQLFPALVATTILGTIAIAAGMPMPGAASASAPLVSSPQDEAGEPAQEEPGNEPSEEQAENLAEELAEAVEEDELANQDEEDVEEGLAAPVMIDEMTDLQNGHIDRRVTDEELVTLNFQDEKIDAVIPYIVEWTGKTVMLRLTQIAPMKITLVNDRPISKHEALDLLFQAFRLNGVGVVETDKVIMIDSLDQETIRKLQPGVVLGPEVDIMMLPENGNVVIKVFKLEHAKASDVYDRLESTLPGYASLTADANSNQLILEGDVGLAKQIQRLINLLDVPPFLAVKTETFRLAYADAQTVADIVLELFSSTPGSGASRSSSSRRTPTQNRSSQRTSTAGNQSVPQVGVSEQLQVSVLPQINSVTVRAEPDILNDIRFLIENAWDIPPSRNGDIFRLYNLEYTDPIKVKNLLSELLETGGGGGGARGGAGRANAASGGADIAVADIFRIEAYPDSNRLVIISKTPDNFDWLDQMIEEIDQPLSVGMPVNIELKYASAIEVSDILNALLAQSGGGGRGIQAPEEGLGGINFESAGTGADTSGTDSGTEEITFPWQSGRGANSEEAAEVSGLVGKSRVVPNPGQNSLLVLAPPEIQGAVLEIIQDLDRPGRQVMITAVLAEVTLGDNLDLGIRIGSGISSTGDNIIQGSARLDLSKNPLPWNWFTTSALNINTGTGANSVNFILEALSQQNDVRVLQRPRVFTSDNKEAVFFAGQDVSFQTGSTSNDQGTTQSFDTQAIGVGLNVRPRITADRNVAMQIQVLLSDINTTANFGAGENPVVNRRETTTTITVENNQTIVISGIRFEREQDILRKVPLLGDIPVLGNVFQSTDKSKEVKELLVFITPAVVDNPSENDRNFNVDMRERLEELSLPLKELEAELRKDYKDNDGNDDDFFDHLGGQEDVLKGDDDTDDKDADDKQAPAAKIEPDTDPIVKAMNESGNTGKSG